jgi:diguanylate cyclase (GGDEF)-like protein
MCWPPPRWRLPYAMADEAARYTSGMAHPHPAHPPDSRRVARALAVAGLLIVAITLAVAGLLYSSYRSTIEREQTSLRNLASAYASQAYYAMLALDTTLARGAAGPALPAGSTMAGATATRIYLQGRDGRRTAPEAAVGGGLDAALPAPGGPAQVALGEPGRGGTITLSRPLGAHGEGAGSIVIETDAAYFQRIFASADLGSGGSVTLLRRDGLMLVRSPTLPHAIGSSFRQTPLFQVHLPARPAGAFEATSPIDGKRRLYGYSAVADYPLVIITGRDKADTLAVWHGWLWTGVLAWGLLSATLALLAWRIGREASRQAALIERLQTSESRLTYLADFDLLTALPNQNQLRRTLKAAIHGAGGDGGQVILILAELERLHEVADLLGHEAGDEVVREVAGRLLRLATPAMCLARVKANEFGLLLSSASPARPVEDFAFELHALLSQPVRVRDREFHLAPLIGIAVYPEDAGSVNELMRLADIAKHQARGDSGEPVRFHSEATHVQLDERLSIEEQLRRALERSELSVAYQPKVEIATGRITGFEALLRWHNPLLGQVPPARFIPVAEQTGLILPIGDWVLRTACEQASAWGRELGMQPRVAVNLSIRQFYQKDLLRTIADTLAGTRLAPDALELEITESIAMSRMDVVERLLAGIRQLGVELAIDDFGTGHSSLAYLKRFPVQCLKIDRAFIRDLGSDEDSAAIVRSIVALARGLKMRTVAEGVETERQLAMLRELGCDEFQGYLFARPLEPAAVPALLRQGKLGRASAPASAD